MNTQPKEKKKEGGGGGGGGGKEKKYNLATHLPLRDRSDTEV